MSYCTKQNIKDDFKSLQIEASGTIITDSKVDALITQESEYIDSIITKRYHLPIVEADSPKAWEILKRIAIFRVSLRVRNILEVSSDATQANSEEKFVDNKVRTPNDDLAMIEKGLLILIDAKMKEGLGVTKNKTVNCGLFKMSLEQW